MRNFREIFVIDCLFDRSFKLDRPDDYMDTVKKRKANKNNLGTISGRVVQKLLPVDPPSPFKKGGGSSVGHGSDNFSGTCV